MSASLYPLFLNLQGRTCVVIGGSEMAEGKVRDLLDAAAKIQLIAPDVTPQIEDWSRVGKLHWQPRPYQRGDLADAFLVISIADAETNAQVFEEAEARHIFCNAVDDIPHCSSYASAVVRRGPLQIAISTAGNSPALAQRLRKEIAERFGEEYGPWVHQLGELRRQLLRDQGMNLETRRKMFHVQASTSAFESFRALLPKQPHSIRTKPPIPTAD